MNASELASYLLESCQTLSEFESFMFGSSLYRTGMDFDILIVGPPGDHLSRLKAEIRDAGKELPLDLLFMTPSEAVETGFIDRERCVPLIKLANTMTNLCK